MTLEEFRTICIARFGGGWQTKLALSLGVNPRTVRRWAAGEIPVPPPVAAQLGARPAITQEYPDEWLIASDPGEQREYVIHLANPRFVGMLDEGTAEGVTLELRDEIVGRITWVDPPPADLLPLLRSLQKAMNHYSS